MSQGDGSGCRELGSLGCCARSVEMTDGLVSVPFATGLAAGLPLLSAWIATLGVVPVSADTLSSTELSW